jgi:hypothetical protein
MYRLDLPARLVVGVVWVVAGCLKLPDPTENVRAVPTVCCRKRLCRRSGTVVSAVLLDAFVVGISWAWARGLEIECGCFGGGGPAAGASDKYPWEIARDTGLFLLSALTMWCSSTRSTPQRAK